MKTSAQKITGRVQRNHSEHGSLSHDSHALRRGNNE